MTTRDRRPAGQPLDSATRTRLREYIAATTWRGAERDLAIGAHTIRRALSPTGRIRVATARAIRLCLGLDQGGAPVTDALLELVRRAVRDEFNAALDARLTPVLAALHAATPPARGLSPAEYAERAGVSVCTIRRQVAEGVLPHTRLGRRIVIAADAVPTTGARDRIAGLAARARGARA